MDDSDLRIFMKIKKPSRYSHHNVEPLSPIKQCTPTLICWNDFKDKNIIKMVITLVAKKTGEKNFRLHNI